MKAYKVFGPDWTCRGLRYEVGKTFRMNEDIKCCERGFHFAKKLIDCFGYYQFDPENKVAEVEVLGKIDECGGICCTNVIRIVRELSWIEVLEMVNSGRANTGCGNSGNENAGHWNSGNRNIGSSNSGNDNAGHHNTGCFNYGNFNSGGCNSGIGNSGDCNAGHGNSGNYNPGFHNSGNHNSGDYNSGNGNSGSRNSGDCNLGSYNTGDWNYGNRNSGVFNTKIPELYMFDAPSGWTFSDWYRSMARRIMLTVPQDTEVWVRPEQMVDEEKQSYSEYEIANGYLKRVDNIAELRQAWWESLAEGERQVILSLPNFDAEKFRKCTGIQVTEE